jgi:hypothetical protein
MALPSAYQVAAATAMTLVEKLGREDAIGA